VLKLTAAQRSELRGESPAGIRCRIVMCASQGRVMAADGHRQRRDRCPVGHPCEIVSKWCKRFYLQAIAGLEERPRVADLRSFPLRCVVSVKALACELPSRLGVPLSRLHVPDISAEVVSRPSRPRSRGPPSGGGCQKTAIRPWRQPSWILSRDRAFETKAARVARPLRPRMVGRAPRQADYVVSSDEKTSIQARIRCHEDALCCASA